MDREKVNRSLKALVQWDDLREEVEALAGDFDSRGWETLVLHPGDVSVAPPHEDATADEPGFHLVVPESEFESLTRFIGRADSTFDSFEVHRAPSDELSIFVVAMKAPEGESAVCYPVYYEPEYDTAFLKAVGERGHVHTHVTNLAESYQISFRHDDHELFFPE